MYFCGEMLGENEQAVNGILLWTRAGYSVG
jgi:hypothetical protein